MRYIISYDISDNKLRNKLVKILEKYGERVQYSSFEFELNKEDFNNLMSELKVEGFLRKKKGYKLFIYKIKPHLVRQIKRIGYQASLDSNYIIV